MARPKATCSIEGCEKPARYVRLQLCIMHYERLRKNGDPLIVRRVRGTAQDRLRAYVDVGAPSECWPWTSHTNRDGYGMAKDLGKDRGVHVLTYELTYGPVPTGFEIDHICHNEDSDCPGGRTCLHRRCCNPAHLEAVPHRTNALRGRGPTAINARKTCCPNGHEFTPENTYRRPGDVGRVCRTCTRKWG